MKKILLLSAIWLLPAAMSFAKSSAPTDQNIYPGELRWNGSSAVIYLDAGRQLLWPAQGPLSLSAGGQNLAKIDLGAAVQKETGTEALGLSVEETDLGGSLSSKKKYLSGKKAPTGRRLSPAALPTGTDGAGQETQSVIDGVTLSTIQYPNGASLWKWQWPGYREELFFDKKKSLVYNRQLSVNGGMQISLQQFADGSFRRQYQGKNGIFDYVYDANDASYRLSFANPQGEIVSEWSCEQNCEPL